MDRRGFLKFLGKATAGAYVAYSFLSIIKCNNLILPEEIPTSFISQLNAITKREIYPKLIEDLYFTESPLFAYFEQQDDLMNQALKTVNRLITNDVRSL